MNFITHSTIYALYPHATFESGLNLHVSCDGRDQDAARTKYSERGWTRVQRVFKSELFKKPSPSGRARQAFSLSARWATALPSPSNWTGSAFVRGAISIRGLSSQIR